LTEDWQAGGFGLYLHWPFCQAKCPYCDFNSHVTQKIDEARWTRAYLAEIDRLATETSGRILQSVFLGGGTPSLMSADLVAALLERIRARWQLAPDAEITLEANPTSVEAARFRGYAAAGVNRVSLGVQALNDADLRRLGRLHSVAEARTAFDIARTTFARVSFDLIYARQDQDRAAWAAELAEALSMAADHLSLYQLTIEEGTAFGDRRAAGKLAGLPDEDLGADLYELTQDMTAAAGFAAYEVSNHAVAGQQGRHNLIYWRAGDWGGIGPGAHGRLTLGGQRWSVETAKAPTAWLQRVETSGSGEVAREIVDAAAHVTEVALMGLRLAEGLDARRFARLSGGRHDTNIAYLCDIGMMQRRHGRLLVSPVGRPVLNAVLGRLLAD